MQSLSKIFCMSHEKIVIATLIVALIFVISIAIAIDYSFNNSLGTKNAQIALLKAEAANLTDQTKNLTSQVSNLTQVINSGQTGRGYAHLVGSFGVTEIPAADSMQYPRLYIEGSVGNTGNSTAYNAGLHVVAYVADGTVEINMTVPLDNGGDFGTGDGASAYVQANAGAWGTQTSLQLESVGGWQIVAISLNIYHEGTVATWTITPVWTNTP